MKVALTKLLESDMIFLNGIGCTEIKTCSGYDLSCNLPEGWMIHDISTDAFLLDPKGRIRAQLLSVERGKRFIIPWTAFIIKGVGKNTAFQILNLARTNGPDPVVLLCDSRKDAEAWLDLAYPLWSDPLAYW